MRTRSLYAFVMLAIIIIIAIVVLASENTGKVAVATNNSATSTIAVMAHHGNQTVYPKNQINVEEFNNGSYITAHAFTILKQISQLPRSIISLNGTSIPIKLDNDTYLVINGSNDTITVNLANNTVLAIVDNGRGFNDHITVIRGYVYVEIIPEVHTSIILENSTEINV